ncbi:MAG: hypothetical protein HZB43_06385 [candidate division Zixibacteria bacterium]|nr:hypothetical protein [candidate division Zixibacteria bacterium]
MKSKALFAIAIMCLAAIPAYAVDNNGTSSSASFSGVPRANDLVGAVTKPGFSLLDPARFKIRNSYSLSFLSGSGQSASVGMFMSTIEYQLSQPLSLRVGLGYLHQPLGFLKNTTGPGQGRFLPSATLDYRPSDKFHFIVDFRTLPASYGGVGYGRGWGSPYPGSNSLWDW